MIINRYLIQEISRPLLAICSLLVILFVSYSSADYLADAAEGLLPYDSVFNLILLKSVVAIEVLLPISLYLSVIVGLGRLYTDHEMIALAASGFSEFRVLRTVFKFSILLAVLVGFLSIWVRPWAYQKTYALKAEVDMEFNLNKLEAQRFYSGNHGEHVIFANKINREIEQMEQVFFSSKPENKTRIIYAENAYQPIQKAGEPAILVFLEGYGYELDHSGDHDIMVKFHTLTLKLEQEPDTPGYRSKAAKTIDLAHSIKPKDIAEFQWRLSRPLGTLLLGMIAVPLSRATPRQGKYAKTIAAILIYALYYNLTIMAKSSVKDGVVGSIPGLWWPDALLAALLVSLLLWPVISRKLTGRIRN